MTRSEILEAVKQGVERGLIFVLVDGGREVSEVLVSDEGPGIGLKLED